MANPYTHISYQSCSRLCGCGSSHLWCNRFLKNFLPDLLFEIDFAKMDVVTGLFMLVALGLTSFHFYVRYKRTGRLATKVPGPAPYPFIGNMLDFDISSPGKFGYAR